MGKEKLCHRVQTLACCTVQAAYTEGKKHQLTHKRLFRGELMIKIFDNYLKLNLTGHNEQWFHLKIFILGAVAVGIVEAVDIHKFFG